MIIDGILHEMLRTKHGGCSTALETFYRIMHYLLEYVYGKRTEFLCLFLIEEDRLFHLGHPSRENYKN